MVKPAHLEGTDRNWLERCRAGDRQAITAVVARHHQALLRYILVVLADWRLPSELALDVMQETFQKLLETLGKPDCPLFDDGAENVPHPPVTEDDQQAYESGVEASPKPMPATGDQCPWERTPLIAWLKTTARNAIRNNARKKTPAALPPVVPVSDSNVFDEPDFKVWALCAKHLTRLQQRIVRLRAEGATWGQIAARLEISPGKAMNHQKAAAKRLGKLLGLKGPKGRKS